MSHMEVHSYGKCLRRKDEPPKAKGVSRRRGARSAGSRARKFYLAFENACAGKDDLSEKLVVGRSSGLLVSVGVQSKTRRPSTACGTTAQRRQGRAVPVARAARRPPTRRARTRDALFSARSPSARADEAEPRSPPLPALVRPGRPVRLPTLAREPGSLLRVPRHRNSRHDAHAPRGTWDGASRGLQARGPVQNQDFLWIPLRVRRRAVDDSRMAQRRARRRDSSCARRAPRRGATAFARARNQTGDGAGFPSSNPGGPTRARPALRLRGRVRRLPRRRGHAPSRARTSSLTNTDLVSAIAANTRTSARPRPARRCRRP